MTPVALIDNEPLEQPIQEEFRAGTITLSWDADDERVVIEVFPVAEVEVELPVEAAEQELIDLPIEEPEPEEVLLVRMPPAMARSFAARAESVVAAGRAPCPFCGGPIDAEGHLCPRANGYRRSADLTPWPPPAPSTLLDGQLVVLGRIMPASNHTFLTRLGDEGVQCVYKPSSGERPLWDFTDGTLADREYAAWVISDHLGWDVVPPTVLRDGPAGPGHGAAVDGARGARRPRPGRRRTRGSRAARLPARARCHRRPRRAGRRSCTRTPSRCAGWPSSTSSPTTPTARAATCCRCATGTATASTTASASTPRTSCARCSGAGPASRCRPPSAPGSQSIVDGLDGDLRDRLEDLLTVREVDAIERRCERLLRQGRFPIPAGGWPVHPLAALLRAGR